MAVGLNNAPLPIQERLIKVAVDMREKVPGFLEDVWIDFLQRMLDQINAGTWVRQNVGLATQGASIGATDFSGGGLSAGLYRITYYTRITRAASVSSSLIVTFDWTDQGVSVSASGTAITGNTTSTFQSGTLMIYTDSNSPVRYSTTYVSVGATSMQYKLLVTLEEMVA